MVNRLYNSPAFCQYHTFTSADWLTSISAITSKSIFWIHVAIATGNLRFSFHAAISIIYVWIKLVDLTIHLYNQNDTSEAMQSDAESSRLNESCCVGIYLIHIT